MNICRSFAAGKIAVSAVDVAWIVVVALLLAPYPFRLMRRRIIK